MATTTDFLGLSLPEGGEGIKRIMFNGNFELIDKQAQENADAAATANSMARKNNDAIEAIAIEIKECQEAQELHAAPMQDATVEGRYMLFAEYSFPKLMNFESADLTLLIRNRGVLTTAKDGILRVRLRYGKASAAFQYAQIYWLVAFGIDASKFILCYNNATATAQLYIDTAVTYDGYICKVLDMGTSASIVDYATWTLHSPTTGATELPSEADGWTSNASAPVAVASE